MSHDATLTLSESVEESWFDQLPIARWGRREVARVGIPSLALSAGALALGGPWRLAALVPAAAAAATAWFYRDTPRSIPTEADVYLAPADGCVTDLTRIDHYHFFNGPATQIGLFLSLLDGHVNRVPRSGRVVETHYQEGQHKNATSEDAPQVNEFQWIGMEDQDGRRYAMRQVSGAVARRIVCELSPGDEVERGAKLGMIKLGSRAELIVPEWGTEIAIKMGDRVRAGETILALSGDVTHVPLAPTLLTLGNLVCGLAATVAALRFDADQSLLIAAACIGVAALLDALDGAIARALDEESRFGAALDSLADIVSFGVAPASLLSRLCPTLVDQRPELLWPLAALLVCCVALRLARFQAELGQTTSNRTLVGLPSPAAALSLASLAPLAPSQGPRIEVIAPAVTLIVAGLLVSGARYPHAGRLVAAARATPRSVGATLLGVVRLLTLGPYAAPIACGLFVVWPLICRARDRVLGVAPTNHA